MTLIDRLGDLPLAPVTLELRDIQATVLRYRPEPCSGTHVMLHVNNARSGREFLRRLAPYVDSAAEWWQGGEAWIAVALTYSGLEALEVSQESLQSFPETFRLGMAARAGELLDEGANDPKRWEPPFGSGLVHVGVSVFSDSHDTSISTMDSARRHWEGVTGLTVLAVQDFGARPGDLNPLGYKDLIGQPAIEGSGVDPLPGQGRPIKAGKFILGYPARAAFPSNALAGCSGPQRHVRRTAQVSVASRDVQPLSASECRDRRGTGVPRGQTRGSLAQRSAADACADPGRPCARRRPIAQ